MAPFEAKAEQHCHAVLKLPIAVETATGAQGMHLLHCPPVALTSDARDLASSRDPGFSFQLPAMKYFRSPPPRSRIEAVPIHGQTKTNT